MAGGARRIALAASIAAVLAGYCPTGEAAAMPVAVPRSGVVAGSFSTSARQALSHWTAARRREAEPLAPRLLNGRSSTGGTPEGGEAVEQPSYVPPSKPGASAGGLRSGALRRTAADAAAIEGTDTGDSTAFPDSANGIVYGEYRTRRGDEDYQCSGSVISSGGGNVILTAGHCVIDPETGTVASYVVFVPGYREKDEPFGEWGAEAYATTSQWAETAGTREPNEAGDLAMLVLEDHEGKGVQSEVGALGIAFNQAREQTYTQYGYPAEEPYDGEALYSHLTPYAGEDSSFSPPTMKIASDFTAGSSGGPWTVGEGPPTVLSITDYGYEEEPGYLFGSYFGSTAQDVYEEVEAATEEEQTAEGGASSSDESGTSASTGQAQPSESKSRSWLRLVGIRRSRSAGTAALLVEVSGRGKLRLSGREVRQSSLMAQEAGRLSLLLRAGGSAAKKLRSTSHAAVVVQISFWPVGQPELSKSRLVRLAKAQ